jgi:hypothetical protein
MELLQILYAADGLEGCFLVDGFFIPRGEKTTIIFPLVKSLELLRNKIKNVEEKEIEENIIEHDFLSPLIKTEFPNQFINHVLCEKKIMTRLSKMKKIEGPLKRKKNIILKVNLLLKLI